MEGASSNYCKDKGGRLMEKDFTELQEKMRKKVVEAALVGKNGIIVFPNQEVKEFFDAHSNNGIFDHKYYEEGRQMGGIYALKRSEVLRKNYGCSLIETLSAFDPEKVVIEPFNCK